MYYYLKYCKRDCFITDNNKNAYIGLDNAISIKEIEVIFRNDKNIIVIICVVKEDTVNNIYSQIKRDLKIPEDIIFWYSGG